MDILIGADPEFFVRSKKTGELVSAHGLIAGTKAAPIPMGPGHAQVDGMALEINVPPSKDARGFIDGFNGVMDALKKELPDFTFDFSPVAHFGEEVIKAQPREARELGCEPDFSAYSGGKANPRPNADTPFRTASGHVHIGWTNEQDTKDPDHIDACNMFSRQLDFYLGLPSLLWDADTVRRQLYGKAGCYRPKHYGMEYRTLSNAWLTDEKYIAFVVEQSIKAFEDLVAQNNYGNVRGLQGMIDGGDWKNGVAKYSGNMLMPPFLDKMYQVKYREWQAARDAELNRVARDKNAGKGDVNGKGFPANHLAKVAWGKRQVAFENAELAPVGAINPAGEIPLGAGAGVVEWVWNREIRNIEVRRPAMPPAPPIIAFDDVELIEEDDNEWDWEPDEVDVDEDEEV